MSELIRILYVEDSLLDRELVRDALEQEHGGFKVIEARNRTEFMARLAEGEIDLVLTDFDIVGFKGLQVLDMVHEKDPNLPVVVVTGTGSEEVAVEAMKRGAADYVIKSPHHIRRLPLTITTALKNHRLSREREQYYQALQESERKLKALNEELEERVQRRTAALAERTEEVRRLARALTLAEHVERRRISQMLHEDLQQILYGLRIRSHILLQEISAQEITSLQELGQGINDSTERAIDIARSLSVKLNPPVFRGEGVEEILQWLVHHMREWHGLTVQLKVQGEYRIPEEDKRLLLVQLIRELLLNVVNHAGVNEAVLEAASQDKELVLRIINQGIGIDAERLQESQKQRGDVDFVNIKERLDLLGGKLQIASSPKQGTEVTIVVPLEDNGMKID